MPAVAIQRCHAAGHTTWLCGDDPVEVIATDRLGSALDALKAVERGVNRGLHAVGYIAYEAASGLDGDLCTFASPGGAPGTLPLVWFALFRELKEVDDAGLHIRAGAPTQDDAVGPWRAQVSIDQYRVALARIKDYIAAGDTYQVNYTFAMEATFHADPWTYFLRLCAAQRSRYCAYLDTGRHTICSASPELFFSLDGDQIIARPMKGTAPRAFTCDADDVARTQLRGSPKNRAENTMIVDMIRNDLGRIATPGSAGSVRLASLFDIEQYPTVFQMTSTVAARTTASWVEIVRALFPCASVTGAPKVRTMQIIRELEAGPRGVYTGAIGWLRPQRQAQFNVAIRTVTVDRDAGRARYAVGGGIVWDSQADEEYAECQTKAAVLAAPMPSFDLLETMLYEGAAGFFLRAEHLVRLERSARYFDVPLDAALVRARLQTLAQELGNRRHRVRLLVDGCGGITLEATPWDVSEPMRPWRLRLAERPVDSGNVFLYHKTTCRSVYEEAKTKSGDGRRASVASLGRAEMGVKTSGGECDEVVLWNERREITETTIANLVAELDGRRVTPPVSCGLLAGVFREHLLATGQVVEQIITSDSLRRATRLWCVNSLRRWVPAVLI